MLFSKSSMLNSISRTFATVSHGISSRYPPRKQLIWSHCQELLKKQFFMLVQIDNLDAKARGEMKTKLATMGLTLQTPKTHILRKAVRLSKFNSLEGAIVGFTGVIHSRKEPCELKEGLQYLSNYKKMTILGGFIGKHVLSTEGMKEVINTLPSLVEMKASLVNLLQSPSQQLVSMCLKAPSSLASLLQQRIDTDEKETTTTEEEK